MRNLELISIAWLVVQIPLAIANKKPDDPSCLRSCGNVSIDYPFGIGEGCYLNEAFEVSCIDDVLTLAKSDSKHKFNISEIRLPDQVLLLSNETLARDCKDKTKSNVSVSFVLGEPFKVSSRANRFRAMGCDITATVSNINYNYQSTFGSECNTQWIISSAGEQKYGGLGQCQIALPYNSSGYGYFVSDMFNYTDSACWRTCSYAVLAEEGYNISNEVLDGFPNIQIPLVAEWAIQDRHCNKSDDKTYNTSVTCGQNAWCNYTASESGYNCYCNSDCKGNPYLNGADGCQTGERKDDGRKKNGSRKIESTIIAAGVLSTAMVGASLYSYGSWSKMKATTKFTFKLLQDLHNIEDESFPDTPVFPDTYSDVDPSSFDGDGGPDTNPDDPNTEDGGPDRNPDDPNTEDGGPDRNPDDRNKGYKKQRDFNQHDLKKAIKLHQKGQRTAIWGSRHRVAIANLPDHGVVEIRKYTVQERSHLPLFVKGVRALCRTLTHDNVSTLLGISTRESSLIYKHFSDRTLHDNLHCSPSDRPSWEERLKIAAGTARGLAFTHSKGLYHGNVKSSNILIDEECNCKLVEFGVARVWRKNTLLKSSRGYVDQEYMNLGTNQLIASMDVYSFRVVLVELITGQDPSSKAFNQRGRRSLAMVFMSAVDEGRLEEVVDHSIWAEERKEQLLGVADLAKECLKQGRKEMPKMQTVRNSLLNWAPKGPRPQGGRRTNATGSQPGVVQNPDSQGQTEIAQGQAQSALDVGQNVTEDFAWGGDDGGVLFES